MYINPKIIFKDTTSDKNTTNGWRPDKETLEEYIYSRRKVLLDQEIK
jgi:hypothetical protein